MQNLLQSILEQEKKRLYSMHKKVGHMPWWSAGPQKAVYKDAG